MSSFNINNTPSSQPMIQGSQNLGKDGGGGGSTGYMNMRGKKKKKNQDEEEDNSVFLEEEIKDTFEKEGSEKKPKKNGKFLGAIQKFMKKDKGEEKPKTDDTFVKSSAPKQKVEEEDEDNFQKYNVKINRQAPEIEDEEYEIIDGDDYYERGGEPAEEEDEDDEEGEFYQDIDV